MTDYQDVKSTDLVRNFARYCAESISRPIRVSHWGRNSHILIGVEKFEQMARALADNRAHAAMQTRAPRIADWLDQAAIVIDSDMIVRYANRIAAATCGMAIEEMLDRPVHQCVPHFADSLMEVYVRRTMRGREINAADMPSPVSADVWIHFQSFPLGADTALLFRDITEDVQHHRLADLKAAIIEAMNVHGEIGYVRVSVRGTIERADTPFVKMVGVKYEKMLGTSLADFIPMQQRMAYRDALESVLGTPGARVIRSAFISNEGLVIPVRMSIVGLHGAYGTEGAVVVLTRAGEDEAA